VQERIWKPNMWRFQSKPSKRPILKHMATQYLLVWGSFLGSTLPILPSIPSSRARVRDQVLRFSCCADFVSKIQVVTWFRKTSSFCSICTVYSLHLTIFVPGFLHPYPLLQERKKKRKKCSTAQFHPFSLGFPSKWGQVTDRWID
jgi:hypothetical protein